MVGIFHPCDPYPVLQEHLGCEPKYFQKMDSTKSDDLGLAEMIAFYLEVERSVRCVGRAFGMTFAGVRKECLRVNFKFDLMMEEAVRSDLTHRELKRLHMIGGAHIKQIEERLGTSRPPRNSSKRHSDADIELAFYKNKRNALKAAKVLGICRTTVSAAVKRQIARRCHAR